MIPPYEVGCKICEKSIYRIFVEHIQEHLDKELCRPVADESQGLSYSHKEIVKMIKSDDYPKEWWNAFRGKEK